MIGKRKLKDGWRYNYDKTVRGKRLQSPYIYLSKTDARVAESQAASVYIAALSTGSTHLQTEPPPDWTVQELVKQRVAYLTAQRSPKYAYDVKKGIQRALALVPSWEKMTWTEITLTMVEEWMRRYSQYQSARGHNYHEVRKAISYLQTAFNYPWGRKRRSHSYNPFAEVQLPSTSHRPPRIPSSDQVESILATVKGLDLLWCVFLLDTGARASEAMATTLQEVDFERRTVALYTRKKKDGSLTPGRVPLSERLGILLSSLNQPPDAPIFDRNHWWPYLVQHRVCEQAKVPYFSTHGWRHYYASRLSMMGVPLPTVQRLLRHESITTTARYIHELVGGHYAHDYNANGAQYLDTDYQVPGEQLRSPGSPEDD
jgi:integrase